MAFCVSMLMKLGLNLRSRSLKLRKAEFPFSWMEGFDEELMSSKR